MPVQAVPIAIWRRARGIEIPRWHPVNPPSRAYTSSSAYAELREGTSPIAPGAGRSTISFRSPWRAGSPPGSRVRVPSAGADRPGDGDRSAGLFAVSNRRARLQGLIGGSSVIRPRLLELARWISEYYCCPLAGGDGLCARRKLCVRRSVSPRRLNFVRLAKTSRSVAEIATPGTAKRPASSGRVAG